MLLDLNKNKNYLYIVSALAVVLWAIVPLVMKASLFNLGISTALAVRFAVSGLLFLNTISSLLSKCKKMTIRFWLIFFGVIAINYFFQSLAIKELPASWYVIIFSMNPIISLLILRVKINLKWVLVFSLALVGTYLFISQETFSSSIGFISWVSMFIGMLTWAVYGALLPKLQKIYTDYEITGLTIYGGLISSCLIWILQYGWGEAQATHLKSIDIYALWAPILLGLVIPLAYWCFSQAIRINPTIGILSQYLEPIFGVILSIIFLNETLGTNQLIGSFIILLSLFFSGKLTQNQVPENSIHTQKLNEECEI